MFALLALLLATPALAAPPCEVVTFQTSDTLTLEADYCPAGKDGAPVVVLLHMIPPHHDRTNYPPAFRAKLQDAGFTVLNVDRRGGGKSEGVAKEAYTGPKGKEDLIAARAFLRAKEPKADHDRWACVGASNGTTTCLDGAAHAAATDGVAGPRALVFLTGGKYTETNTALKGSAAAALPVFFTFNEQEKAWSESHRGGSTTWEHVAWSPGGHGTKAFGPNPEAMDAVVAFLQRSVR